ncbi:hypothetical protein [Flavobacterium sp.]|uniref:hypothetical protein n=1 Tax=Flavobacterium sp. TaxID=239 RepID=UPI003753890E
MFFNLTWDIWFYNQKGEFQLRTVKEIEVNSTVDNLADTATITLPDAVLNHSLNIEDKIGRGTKVVIKYGYDNENKTEFIGYVKEITTDNSSLKIECEDALFLFRKSVKDVELKPTSVKKIADYLVSQIDPSFKVVCNEFDLAYEKFVIHQATGYDVLKKLQEETAANIYFDTAKKELHIHPPYIEKGGDVIYSSQKNVRSISLEYKKKIDRNVEVTIESVGKDGKVHSYKTGTTGGESVTRKVGSFSTAAIKKIAEAELLKRSADGYEGSVDTWLIPFVAPTYTAEYTDTDYPAKDGKYYVVSVKTNISSAGGKRTVQFGIKLGNG